MTTHTLPPAVKVRELEFDTDFPSYLATSGRSKRRLMERARHPFGAYFIERSTDDDNWWVTKGLLGDDVLGPFEHDWQAREAIDNHYGAAILSALEPSGEGVGAEPVAYRYRDSRDDRSKWTVQKNPPHWAGQPGWERYTIEPLYTQPLSGMEEAEQRTMETACRILMTKIYNRGHSGLDLDCLLCQAYIAADRLLAFETGSAPSEEVRSWDRRLSTPVSAASPEGEAGKWDDARINDWMGRHEVRLPNPAYDELRSMLSHAPEGFVLVPAEPIGAMIEAGWSVLNSAKWPTPKSIFAAMLAAAPATQEKNRG